MYNNNNISRTTLDLARTRLVNQATRRAVLNQRKQTSNTSKKFTGSKFVNSSANNSDLSAADIKQKMSLTAVKGAAEKLQIHADNLLKKGSASLFTEENQKKALEEIEGFVEQYNLMVDKLKEAGGTVNNFFADQLKDIVKNNEEALKEVGITYNSSGNLRLDESTLKEADLVKLKALFGVSGSFGKKVMDITSKIEKNVDTSLAYYDRSSYTTTYGKYGAYNTYDYRGSSLNSFG